MAWTCHMEKYKASDMGGIGIEDDRGNESINEKNPNLDLTYTDLNVHRMMKGDAYIDTEKCQVASIFSAKKKEINELRKNAGKTSVRKDATVCCSFIISEDHSFFENMTRDDCIKFFETAVNWFNKNFGNNVLQYSIHFDEYTPHMHMRLCPQKGDALSAKTIFDRKALQRIQKELPAYMRSQGYDVGEPNHDEVSVHRDEAEQRIHALNEKARKIEERIRQKEDDIEILDIEVETGKKARDKIKAELTSLRAQLASNQVKIEEQVKVIAEQENRLKTANTRLDEAIINYQVTEATTQPIIKDQQNIIGLRDELTDILNRKSRDLGIAWKKTTEGYVLDMQTTLNHLIKKHNNQHQRIKNYSRHDDR